MPHDSDPLSIEAAIDILLLPPLERPSTLPEIINQVWECSYKAEKFGFLFTTPYGWTHSQEVIHSDVPEEWAHWQQKEMALFRLLDELEAQDALPLMLLQDQNEKYLDMILGDDTKESIIADLVKICDTATHDVKLFAENDKVPLVTVLAFIRNIKREITKELLMLLAEVSEYEDDLPPES